MGITQVIRIILTMALVYGVYTETGIFTALTCSLIAISVEIENWEGLKND